MNINDYNSVTYYEDEGIKETLCHRYLQLTAVDEKNIEIIVTDYINFIFKYQSLTLKTFTF